MKTSILFSAILLVASSSFAQTSVKNQASLNEAGSVQSGKWGTQATNESSAAAATTVKSNAVNNTESRAYRAEAKGKKAAIAAKEQAKKDAVAAKQEAKETASSEEHASAGASAGSTANASIKGNKSAENASLNGQASVSTSAAQSTGNQVKQAGETAVVKAKSTTVKTVRAVKAKPAAVKMNTSIKTNAGIKIK